MTYNVIGGTLNLAQSILKSIASINTNTFVTMLLLFITFSNLHCFPWSSINKVNRMIVVEKMAISL